MSEVKRKLRTEVEISSQVVWPVEHLRSGSRWVQNADRICACMCTLWLLTLLMSL